MRYIISFLLLLSSGVSFTQSYNFEYYLDDVIKSSFIYDIDQNKNGELILATSEGVFVFDGVEFENLFENNSLQDRFVTDVFIDNYDRIWFSLYNGGYGFIENNTVTILSTDKYVTSFTSSNKNGVIVLTKSELFFYNQNNSLINKKDSRILQIEYTDTNEIFYINETNQFLYKSDSEILIQDSVELFTISKVNKIAYLSNNTVYIISKSLRQILSINLDRYNIEKVNQLSLNENVLTISTIDKGVFEYTFFSNFNSFSLNRINTNQGLKSNDVRCSFVDKESNLWIGTYGDGIIRLPKNRILSYSIFKDDNDMSAIKINSVLNVNNKLFLGTTNGLKTLQKKDSKIKSIIDDINVISLEKKNNVLYVGTLKKGLFTLINGEFKRFKFNTNLQPETIGCIKVNENFISVGTNSGLYVHDFNTNVTVNYTTYNGLAHNVIENFVIDNEGYYWIDSPNSPIYKFKNNNAVVYKELSEFKSFNITDFAVTNTQVWITTAGDGVFKYENNEFTQYTSKDGLYSNYIYFIEKTENNFFILGHKNSISNIKLNDSIVNINNMGYIKELNNLLSNSSYLAGKNSVWVGNERNSLLNLSIERFDEEKYVPKLLVSDILLNGKPLKPSVKFNLPYDDYYASFKVKAIYLSTPSSVEYKYKLEGFDKQWTTVKYDDNIIKYQSIKDGDYTFRVRLIIDKKDLEIERVMKIHISKPFWLSIWFYLILLISIMTFFLIAIYLIQRRNTIIKASLEQKVKVRTELIHKKNVNLKKLSEEYLKEKETAQIVTKELTDSITYASKIQKVILRKKTYLKMTDFFKSFYLIFKPKDLVSGDFYWGHKVENFVYVVAGDCTGHGVPGAMLSLLGVSQLNKIVNKVLPTDVILEELRKNIISDLGQENENSIRDGMDLAIVRYNTSTRELQYSGAHNTVLILRNEKQPIVHPEIKTLQKQNGVILYNIAPNKQPVSMYMKMESFKSHTIQLIEGDQIFMSTDGFYDQFGGPRYKKFMKRRFYQLLIDTHNLDAQKQKKMIWNALVEWKGETAQIDDITVVSFKI